MDDDDSDGVVNISDNCVIHANPTQIDTDGDGWGNRCDADYNNDKIVNALDLGLLKLGFFSTDPNIDINSDGIVNVIDLGLFKQQFFLPPGPAGYANWVTNADGDWEEPTNWFPEIVPPSEAHVTINQPAAITVSVPDLDGNTSLDFAAASIDTSEDIVIRLGSLTVGGDVTSTAALSVTNSRLDASGNLTVDGALTLQGATLANATIVANASSDPVVPIGTSNTFENITLGTDLILDNAVRVTFTDGLTLAGGDISLESDNSFTDLRFNGSQDFDGTGVVRFAGGATVDDRNRLYMQANGQVLAIGAGITFDTETTGGRIGFIGFGDIELEGTVVSDVSGREVLISGSDTATTTIGGSVTATGGGNLRLEGGWTNLAGNTISVTDGDLELWGDWINNGTILVDNGAADFGNGLDQDWANNGTITLTTAPLNAGGAYDLAQLVSITTDSPVEIDGNLDNTGTNLNVDDFPAGITLISGGTIIGGTVSGNGSLGVSGTNANLDGVTLAADAEVENGGRLDIMNDLTLAGGDVVLMSNNSFTDLRFDGTQTLGGNGSVRFAGGATVDDRNRIYCQANGQVLTITGGVTIETDTVGGRLGFPNFGDIQLLGSVESDVPGREIIITGSAVASTTLGGSITGTGGGNLRIDGAWTNLAGNTISMNGGDLELWGEWVNNGTILATGGTVDMGNALADDWVNNGTITLTGSPLAAGGAYDLGQLLSITTDSTVIIDGDLDNNGTNLNVDDFSGGITLVSGGTIFDGTVSGSGGLDVSGTNANLDGVTLATDVTVASGGRLDVMNDLILVGSDIILTSNNAFTDLRFDGSQTLGGTGKVLFAGSATVDDRNRIYCQANGQVVTIAAGVTIETDTTGGRLGFPNFGDVQLLGSVLSDLPGRSIRITGTDMATTTLGGTVTGTGGGDLLIDGAWTNLAGNTISMTGGELGLWGDWLNSGTILGTNATVDIGNALSDAWTNSGTITLVNSPLTAGGAYDLARLVSITTNDEVRIDGDFDNTGTTFNVDTFTGGVVLTTGGTIIRGTVSGGAGFSVSGINADLDGVTLATDVTIDAGGRLDVENGLTLSNADITFESDNAFTDLRFDGTQTLAGQGNLRFAGTTTVDDRNRIYQATASDTVTIASNITVETPGTAGGRVGLTNAETIFQGSILSTAADRGILLYGSPFTLEGSISIGETSSVDLVSNGEFEMSTTGSIDIDIGPTDFGTMSFNDSPAFDGDLNLALVSGASPSACEIFQVFDYETFSGAFAAVTGPDFGGGQTFDVILLEDIGLLQVPGVGCTYEVSRLAGNTETASTENGPNAASRANDSATNTYWCADASDASPTLTVELPADATVYDVEIDNALGLANQFTTARIRLLNASDTEIYNSGVFALSNGDVNHDVAPDTAMARKVIFEGITWGGGVPCIGELDAYGTQP